MRVVLLALLSVSVLAFPTEARAPRVRPLSNHVADLVQDAAARSPTVARLLAAIEASDVILQIDVRYDLEVPRAMTHLVTSTAEDRFVRTVINRQMSPWQQIELLAHELQHVVEIAADPNVRDQKAMEARFALLGWREGRYGAFETAAAIEAERQARRELSAH